jgi:hypothetical protein
MGGDRMGSVFTRALGSLVGGLFMIGYHFWVLKELTSSKAALYVGIWLVVVGVFGLAYWRWRTNRKKAQQISN